MSAQGQAGFYTTDSIQEIRIVFKESNWRHILDSLFQNYGEEARLDATVFINGQKYNHAGVRYKGFSSYDVDQAKNPFNIDLNYGYSWQNHEGYVKLKLSNVIHDPSFVREVLSYEIARNYMPASGANFANVYINDTLMGLYTSVEAVDKNFIESHFPNSDNTFFKGSPENLEYPFGQNANLAYTHGDEPEGYTPFYKMESSTGWDRLFNLIDVLNNDTANIADVLNIDRALWMHAFNYSMINLDSYIGYSQNYYMYEDDNGCFNAILWDLNMSFGSFRQSDGTSMNLSIDKIKEINPLQHLYSMAYSPRPLMKNLFLNTTYRRMYLAHLRTIMDEQFKSGYYYTRGQQLQAIIDGAVLADTNKFYSFADFTANLDSTTGPYSDQYPGLRDLMEARIAYLDTFPGIQGAPELSLQQLMPERPSDGQVCQVNCKVTGASEVYLFYRTTSDGRFSALTMYDDGAHCDYFADDSIYGATLTASGDILQYYFYAQNDSAGRFLPERAQYELFTVYPEVSAGTVVINELKLKNDGTVADQDGEYDGWIELYNNSQETIQLGGLKLYYTFNIEPEPVYAFPDTLLSPDEFLVVWIDGDSAQSGLHSDIEISDTGWIGLGYDSTSLVDGFDFGYQTDSVSFGSFPNGSTVRGFLVPSFASQNYRIVSDSGHMILYPNPASDKLFIVITPSSGLESIEIINGQMQRVMIISHNSDYLFYRASEMAEIDVSSLSEGLYFATISCSGRTETVKFVIVR